ncbi:hypothetical protein QUC31_005597, partial [Theobroma cacao]
MIYLNCSTTVNSPEYLDASPCITNSSLPQAHHLYVFLGNLQAASLSNSCDYFLMTPAVIQTPGNLTYADIHKKLTIGYELSWSYSSFSSICESNGGYCPFSDGIGDSKRICCRGPLTSVNCEFCTLFMDRNTGMTLTCPHMPSPPSLSYRLHRTRTENC